MTINGSIANATTGGGGGEDSVALEVGLPLAFLIFSTPLYLYKHQTETESVEPVERRKSRSNSTKESLRTTIHVKEGSFAFEKKSMERKVRLKLPHPKKRESSSKLETQDVHAD